jgi:hypothetical protein
MHKLVIPNYAMVKVPFTSPVSTIKLRKAQLLHIKQEKKFLYKNKEHLNQQLYITHLQAAN